jgi:tagatose 6-phosphate kinase
VLAEPGRTTVLNEPGPTVTSDEWQAFLAAFHRVLATSGAGVAVLSGSLPPGVPVDAYAELGRACREAGIEVVLDADGEPLRHGLAGRPSVVKPNADELARLGLANGAPLLEAAGAVREAGAAAVVVSRGPDGLVAVTPDGVWGAVPPVATGNPTGAGDALVAALARGLAHGWPWPDRLRDGAALSAATVQAEVAGSFDMSTYRSLLPMVELRSLDPS